MLLAMRTHAPSVQKYTIKILLLMWQRRNYIHELQMSETGKHCGNRCDETCGESVRKPNFERRKAEEEIDTIGPGDTRFYEPIKCASLTYHALLDTGTSKSYRSERLFREIEKHVASELKPTNFIVRFADSRSTNTVDINIAFHG